MARILFALLALLARQALGAPSPGPSNDYPHPSNGICTDYAIKETVTWNKAIWGYPKLQNNFDVAVLLYSMADLDSSSDWHPITDFQNMTTTYELSGTFCTPSATKNGKEQTVLLATHGGGYDSRYWSSSYKPEKYSFVQYALNDGYSVFYYDRIGLGQSQIISGYDAQISNQLELLAKIAQGVRNGKYSSVVKASKLVLVGHSLGSFITNGAIAKYPDLAEGVILTGDAFANNTDPSHYTTGFTASTFRPKLASTLSPPFDRDSGYVGFGDIYGHTEAFFHTPLDIPTIEYAQSISQPTAFLELLTTATTNLSASTYKGPVLITTGEYDLLICGGNCVERYEYGLQKEVFSGAKVVETYLHPSAGHGINFAANATVFFEKLIDFVDRNV